MNLHTRITVGSKVLTMHRLIHQMTLMLEATRGQVVLGVGTQLDWVAKEDPTGWMLDMMFIKFLMLRKRQYQMKYKSTS